MGTMLTTAERLLSPFSAEPKQFAACRYAGEVGNLRRVVNPPTPKRDYQSRAGWQPAPHAPFDCCFLPFNPEF